MRKKTRLVALLLVLALCLSLAACGSKDESAASTGTDTSTASTDSSARTDVTAKTEDAVVASTGEVGAKGINTYENMDLSFSRIDLDAPADPIEPTLEINFGMNTTSTGTSYNPQAAQGTGIANALTCLVFDYLWTRDGYNDGAEYSRILEDWYFQDDNTFVMKLKPGVYFSNKEGYYCDMTGEDILFSLESYVTQNSQFAGHMTPYNYETSYVSDDGLTVYLKMDTPYAPELYPVPVISKKWVEENGWDSLLWETDPCGSGPYTANGYVSGSWASVTIKDDYWNKDTFQTPVKTYTLHGYGELSTMYIDLELGTIDLAISIAENDYERAATGESENVLTEVTKAGKFYWWGIQGAQGQNKYLADPAVREAIAYGIDWEAVGVAVFGDLFDLPESMVSTSSSYYDPTVTHYEYDPDHAKQVLTDAGYAEGEVTFNFVGFGDHQQIAEALQGYLSLIGINMEVETYEFTTALNSWLGVAGTCDTAISAESDASGEPSDNIQNLFESTRGAFPVLSVKNDAKMEELNTTYIQSTDYSVRSAAFSEFQHYVHDNYLAYPIAIVHEAMAYRSDVITDINFNSTFLGPDLRAISYVGY